MKNKIPKIIHYCWFGKNEKKELVRRCIASWREKLPDYKIIEWNEDNFDVNQNKYTKEAYENNKWAFVSDYVRLYVLYNYGGIYFDTDVEVFRNFDELLGNPTLFGFQSDNSILTAVIGAEPKNKFIKKLLNLYKDKSFVEGNILNMQTNNDFLTDFFVEELGLKQNNINQILNDEIYVFEKEYFSVNLDKEKNYSVHYGDASWFPYDRAISELKAYRSYYFSLLKVMDNLINKNALKKELYNSNIAVYGNGQVGHLLVNYLKTIDVNPVCIIDRNSKADNYNSVEVIKLKDCEKYQIDNVIITPVSYLGEISKDLNERLEGVKIMSIEDIFEVKDEKSNNIWDRKII